MAYAQYFHDKLKALRPEDTLKPDTVFVAILLHNLKPSDDLVQANALWIKCPKSKDLAALLRAYRKQHPYEICLRHDFREVDSRKLLQELTTRDEDFIALEAVKLSDLARRNTLPQPHRTPLKDVTNKGRESFATATKADPDLVRRAQTPSLLTNTSSSQSPAPTGRTAVRAQTSSSIPASNDAWVDFVFERREYHGRSRQLPYFGRAAVAEMDRAIEAEWHAMNDGQKSYYAARAKRLKPLCGRDIFSQRAFWSFYYDIYFERKTRLGVDWHADFRSTQNFTDEMMSAWRMKDDDGQQPYIDRICDELGPKSLRALTATPLASDRSPTQSSESKDRARVKEEDKIASDECSIKDEEEDKPASSAPVADVASQSGQENPTVHLKMTELLTDRTPEQLENGVDRGIEMLEQIRDILESQPSQDASQWLKTIENVQKQAVRTKTVIGVVGATGAGKSSVINAMLDEERLVPTNCMRACTAVVTEISYNQEDAGYRAEIEFIARKDWEKELKILFQDLIDGSGEVSRECTNEDSDAGIAYAKIRAVYPKLTKEDMKAATVEKLLEHGNVSCLGTERKLDSDDASMFYRKLQHYVDSKEKSTGKDKNDKEKKTREMEFWPLIKVVRLYVRASALATGAVIVDLPGVHDSNQARAAVAQNYMKACTGLWIVAPITRAVDDKSAKTLLGDSFKRQLKMDGGYSTVTFICSKTDDISLTEAQDSLGLEDEMGPLYAKSEEIRKTKKSLQTKMTELKDTKNDIAAAMETAEEEVEVWEKLQEQLVEGKTVYKPKPQSAAKKRKRSEKLGSPRKKSKYAEPDTDDDFIEDNSDCASEAGSDYATSEPEDPGNPLTEDEITSRIAELRATRKVGRSEKAQIDEQMKAVRKDTQELEKQQQEIDAQLSAKCISGRNEYSRSAIQKDFAAGIKELDQELAEEEDAANFNPEVDARDYDEVARTLPVFCVSSRAYQKLKGRLQRDQGVPGFENIEETEIPQLQAHCRKLTEAGREAACNRFLTNLTQLLNSLRLWSCNDGSGRNLTGVQLQREGKVLNEKLDKLDTALEKAVKSVIEALKDEIQDSIYDTFPDAIGSAKTQANDIARKWGAPVNRDNRLQGGLYWATYKAVVRRDGCYTNANGCHNFNEQLTEPIMRHVANPWEKMFSRRVAPVLAGLSTAGGTLLTKFHTEVETRAVKNGASIAAFQMLKQQLPVYKETLKDASSVVKNEITAKQRDINREFVPTIAENMLAVYNTCLGESGPGSYNRMKAHMDRHVDNAKQTMYDDSTEGVQELLATMLNEAKKSLMDKMDEVFLAVKRDYIGVVVGQNDAKYADLLPREQRLMRKAVLDIADGAELAFRRAFGLEPEQESEREDEGPQSSRHPSNARLVDDECQAKEEQTAKPIPSLEDDQTANPGGDAVEASAPGEISKFSNEPSSGASEHEQPDAEQFNENPPAAEQMGKNASDATLRYNEPRQDIHEAGHDESASTQSSAGRTPYALPNVDAEDYYPADAQASSIPMPSGAVEPQAEIAADSPYNAPRSPMTFPGALEAVENMRVPPADTQDEDEAMLDDTETGADTQGTEYFLNFGKAQHQQQGVDMDDMSGKENNAGYEEDDVASTVSRSSAGSFRSMPAKPSYGNWGFD